jgi:hypothetical protein
MVVMERMAGQGLRVGPYVLRVLAVHADEVVVELQGPEPGSGWPDDEAPGPPGQEASPCEVTRGGVR